MINELNFHSLEEGSDVAHNVQAWYTHVVESALNVLENSNLLCRRPNCRHATIKTSPVVLDRIMDGVDGLTSILTE